MDFELLKEYGLLGAIGLYGLLQGAKRVFKNGDNHYLKRIAEAVEDHNSKSEARHTELMHANSKLDKTLSNMRAYSAGRSEGERRAGG